MGTRSRERSNGTLSKAIVFFSLGLAIAIFIPSNTTNQNHNVAQNTWTKDDSKAYAKDMLNKWRDVQWSCLSKLWGKESAWDYNAYNATKVMGKNAGGIPQLLGLDPNTPPTKQIERGLDYIYYRYGTPCKAWHHFKKKGWH